jgi:hypothetical protein
MPNEIETFIATLTSDELYNYIERLAILNGNNPGATATPDQHKIAREQIEIERFMSED